MCNPWLVVIDLLDDVLDVSHASLVLAVLLLIITTIINFTCCVED